MNNSAASASALQPRVLEIFKQLSRMVSGAGDHQAMLQTSVELIRGILNAERCSILLLDHETGGLRLGAAAGLTGATPDAILLRAGEGIAGMVIQSKKPLLATDASQYAGYGATHPGVYHSDSFICVPLIHQEKILGVINVTDKSEGEALTPGDLEVVVAVAGFLALTVHNAALLTDFASLSLRLHNTLNSLPTAVLAVTPGHVVVEANRAALALVGRSAESFSHCPLGSLFPDKPAGQIIALVDQAIRQHASATREIEWRRAGQSGAIPLRIAATPFYAPETDDTIAIVQIEDISLLRQVDELRQVEQMHNNFLSLISHELRTPLTSIKGATHLLQNQFSASADSTQLGLLGIISTNTERLVRMVNQLIDVAQIQQGNFNLQRHPVGLDGILRNVISAYENQAANKQIQILAEFDEQALDINVDAEKIQGAFNHLIDNAVKFTPMGGMIRVLAERDGNVILTHIIDSGIGIDPSHWDKVFAKFYQIEDPMTRKTGGAGLGLFLARAIVLLHQGKIELQPPGDKGTHITVTLPAAG